MREKSGKEKEHNESIERELRPWNVPAPIVEMEFRPKFQEKRQTRKRKRETKKGCKTEQEGFGDGACAGAAGR